MSKNLITPAGFLSYPHIDIPQEESKPNGRYDGYSMQLLIPEGVDIDPVVRSLQLAVHETWGENPPADVKDNKPISKTENSVHGTCWLLKFKRKTRFGAPILIDRTKKPVADDQVRNLFLDGCKVRVVYRPYTYRDTPNGNGVSMGFELVQWIAPGPRLGADPMSVVDDLPPEDEVASTDAVEDLF